MEGPPEHFVAAECTEDRYTLLKYVDKVLVWNMEVGEDLIRLKEELLRYVRTIKMDRLRFNAHAKHKTKPINNWQR